MILGFGNVVYSQMDLFNEFKKHKDVFYYFAIHTLQFIFRSFFSTDLETRCIKKDMET